MSSEADFEGTLEALQQAREASEADYFAALDDLRARTERLLAAARDAERLAAHGAAVAPEPMLDAPVAAPDSRLGSADGAGQEPWPRISGGSRGWINRAARWLLRDYLATLDVRHEAVERALLQQRRESQDALDRVLESMAAVQQAARRGDVAVLEAAAESDAGLRELAEALREALNRAAEAIDLLSRMAERGRLLTDAKDAENLQRAVCGPARKMEVMFDEFGRQQEALLAELVGRRRHLDELIETLGRGERSVDP